MDPEEEYYEKLQEILERLPDVSFGSRNTIDMAIHLRIIESINKLLTKKILSKRMRVKIDDIKAGMRYYIREYLHNPNGYELLIELLYLYEDILNIVSKLPLLKRYRMTLNTINEVNTENNMSSSHNKTKKASKKRHHI